MWEQNRTTTCTSLFLLKRSHPYLFLKKENKYNIQRTQIEHVANKVRKAITLPMTTISFRKGPLCGEGWRFEFAGMVLSRRRVPVGRGNRARLFRTVMSGRIARPCGLDALFPIFSFVCCNTNVIVANSMDLNFKWFLC